MANRYWNKQNASAAMNVTAPTNWGSASNTADNASVPGTNDDVFFDGVGGGAADCTQSALTFKSLDCTGYTNSMAWSLHATLTISGNGVVVKLPTNATNAGATNISFTGSSGTILFTPSVSGFPLSVTITATSTAVVQLQAALSLTSITHNSGGFDDNGFSVTMTASYSSSNSTARSLNLAGVWTFTGNSASWSLSTSTNMTLTMPTTGIIKMTSNDGATTRTFDGGGLTYNDVQLPNKGLVTGSNTFRTLAINSSIASTAGVKITSGTTQTVKYLTTNGTALLSSLLAAVTAASPFTINQPRGGVFNLDYISLQDCTATGAYAYAGIHSTLVSGTTGWVLQNAPNMQLTF